MIKSRTIILSLVLASTALAPAAALAKNGADDAPGDDRGGQTTTANSPDDNPGTSGKTDKAKRAKKEIRVAGSCTGDSTAKLKVKRDRGRLKTEFEVDQNANGVAWAVKLSRNGTVVVNTTRTTHAPSGSFSLERRLANGAGPDTSLATATSPTGEVCTATATV
ncbi:MAG: hypothetical protein QOJ89_4794 [bacterium]